ncbi:hypothetical protein COT42_01125 [Candidatus Saganbacteria bacterium CG08_land_8_20_14_0_20_45_16]|uniref:Uncharacterized protein n=1 Tax=Candidatus Saganbacteria bacterium CG08_land_8_20_14_0_20_45_16 TaxID=2014293 RepID=A0A2H0Y244_UNCSA|nr:MAG: hypothetical protein COT42_01125 [Candidatus Saganbacteria bacterium CG08_land_8_20_14_0_20_45_16]
MMIFLANSQMPEWLIAVFGVGGALVFVFWELRSIFSTFGSSNTFFGSGKKAKRILETGEPAGATVLSLSENSKGGVVTLNDQPYLNLKLLIEAQDSQPYEVSFDTIINRSDVPQFQPGAKFKVKIDPADPQIVVIDGIATANERPRIGGEKWAHGDAEIIKERGINGVATLLSVEETGRSKDFKPEVKMCWQMKTAKWGEYEIKQTTHVTSQMALQLKNAIGKSFPAKVHPENKERTSMEINF